MFQGTYGPTGTTVKGASLGRPILSAFMFRSPTRPAIQALDVVAGLGRFQLYGQMLGTFASSTPC